MVTQVINEFGSPAVFETIEMPKPAVTSGHVVIEVKATSINPVDLKIRSGDYGHISPDFPAILHGDVAGVVAEVGAGVTEFQVGDEVYGCAGGVKGSQGALTDFMLADAKLLAKKPQSLSMAEAAALPLVAITAWEALVDKAQIKAGQKILIYGGTGGVGSFAVQLAEALGAEVYTTASSPEKAALVPGIAADHIINYREESVADFVARLTQGKGFEVVFDTVGGKNLETSMQALSLYGSLITIQAGATVDLTGLHLKAANLKCVLMLLPMLANINREAHGTILREVAKLVDAGKIKPLVYPEIFTFANVESAHDFAETGKGYGKIVLENK